MAKAKFFLSSEASPFQTTCAQIEADLNYREGVSNKELFNLVIDENGNSRYAPRRSALVIDDSSLTKLGCKIYDVRIASKSCINDSDYPVWNIDNSVVILVSNDGKTSMHAREAASQNKWDAPLSHLSADQFLGCPCLHPEKSNEVKKIMEDTIILGPQ